MRRSGAVTVVFSLVFLFLFSFILSFFEMASYTARLSFHASAARLATENYFASYLEPMYSDYHIFGREIPEGEDVVSWTEDAIAEDVFYMTEKKDGEKSLLLRGGAEYTVNEVDVLTDNEAEGYYTQALSAMRYRGVSEAAELLKAFSGMSEQAEAHLTVAAAKAATDSAYGEVDEKLLCLMTLVDGVNIKKYEKFLGGKLRNFQNEMYVKYFCTNPEEAAVYFDRTEVYQAFLHNHENPCEILDKLCKKVKKLTEETEEREEQEEVCRSGLAETTGRLSVISEQTGKLEEALLGLRKERNGVATELLSLKLFSGSEDAIKELEVRAEKLDEEKESVEKQLQQAEREAQGLKQQKKEWEKEEKRLEKLKKEQERAVKELKDEEEKFVKRCRKMYEVCEEAYKEAKEIRSELKTAQGVKKSCESVINSMEAVLGNEVCGEYRKSLEEYLFYESAEGYDFEQIGQTLSENKLRLQSMEVRIGGSTSAALKESLLYLTRESELIGQYSFEGLKLDYGELSLEKDIYSDAADTVSGMLADGFLGFLTEQELSEKKLDISYLPSGFRFEKELYEMSFLPGKNMSGVLSGLKAYLPEELSLEGFVSAASEKALFHSYLVTHFKNFVEENKGGALSYEQEYLIAGADTDMENLASVAARICGIRTVLQFISVYTDSAKRAPVEQAALAACGIIGLPALKSLIVLLLVFVWALEEALVDTAALLQGKKLPLYPGKTGGSISFSEILLLSKTFVQQKARNKSDGGTGAIGYPAYLQLFLVSKSEDLKKYRSLDVIQENLRKQYVSSFRVNRCVWKIAYRTDKKNYRYRYE